MAPTRVLIDAHGYPPAEIHTLNLRGLETEIQDRYTEMGRIASLTSPTDGDRDLYDALEARWTALCDARDRLTNQPRPNVRDYVGGRVERGAFDPARTPGGGIARRGPGGGPRTDAVALRSDETVAQWGRRTGRLDIDEEPLSLGRLLYGIASGDWQHGEAEARALGESTPGAGGHLVPVPIAGTVIDLARSMTRVVQAGSTVVPMTSASLKYPRLLDPFVPAWRAENTPLTERNMTFDSVTLTAKSLAGYVKISVELDDDAVSIPGVVESNMAKGFAAEIDRAALRGSGSGQEPLGLRGSGVPITALAGAANGQVPGNYDLFLDAIQTIRAANYEPNAAILAPRTQTTLSKLHEGGTATAAYLAPPPALDNFPMLVTNQVPVNSPKGTSNNASDVFVGQWDQLVIGIRVNVRMRILTERYADYNQVAVQADWRGDVAVLQPGAFNIVEGILP